MSQGRPSSSLFISTAIDNILIIFFLISTGLSAFGQAQPPAYRYEAQSRSARIQTPSGEWAWQLYPGNIVKTTYRPNQNLRQENISNAVLLTPLVIRPSFSQSGSTVMITLAPGIRIRFQNDTVQMGTGAERITFTSRKSNQHPGFTFLLSEEERLFGTGERSIPLNRRGYRLPLNNNPWYGYSLNADALNYSVPFVLSDRNYALFFDNPSRGFLDLGKSTPNRMEYEPTSGECNVFVIRHTSYPGIYERYHRLVGHQPLPPRWALGNFMSRFGYRNEQQARTLFRNMKRDSIPFDAIIFDLFWFGDSIQHTLGNLDWVNREAWPDPARMIADFKKEKVKTILITEPFVVETARQYQASLPYLATDSAGRPYRLTDFYFGRGGLLDMFRNDSRDWFFRHYQKQIDWGVDGWWGDLGEPEKHPSDMYHDLKDLGFPRRFSADEVHNLYGHQWSQMLFEKYRSIAPETRLFHLNRSGFAGTPRYSSFPWTGDVSRSWNGLKAQLPNLLGMSLSGVPYVHSDAGGFSAADSADGELYLRWLQMAVFTPIFRPHGTALGPLGNAQNNIPSEPSEWSEPVKSMARAIVRERYRWLPYNYTLSYQHTQQGAPLMRPMFYSYPKDSNAYRATEQYLWGDRVMVVPITSPGLDSLRYYLPEGRWMHVYQWKDVEGGRWITDHALRQSEIPVYVKTGSFLPLLQPVTHTSDYEQAGLDVFYIHGTRPAAYTLYEDDGEQASSLQKGRYELIRFRSETAKGDILIRISSQGDGWAGRPALKKIRLRLPAFEPGVNVFVNGQLLDQPLEDPEIRGLSIPLEYRHRDMEIRIRRRM